MIKQTIEYFLSGLMIAFTISVLILSAVITITTDSGMISVTLIWQSLILSILCALINLVYHSEKLKFIWQSIIGYFLTTSTIIICGLIFDWYGYGDNGFERTSFVFVSFLFYSLFYLITWIIIWKIRRIKKKELNNKLNEYKQKQ